MISDEDVSDFLSHHGVKGQRWGVRNLHRGGTADQRKQGTKKFVRNLAIGTGAGIAVGLSGAVAVKKLLQVTGHNKVTVSLPGFQSTTRDGRKIYGSFGTNLMKVRVKDLHKLHEDPFDLSKIKYWKP